MLEQTFEINCSQGNILKIGVSPKPVEKQFVQEKDLGRIIFHPNLKIQSESAQNYVADLINTKIHEGYEIAIMPEWYTKRLITIVDTVMETEQIFEPKKREMYNNPSPRLNVVQKIIFISRSLLGLMDEISKKAIELEISHELVNNHITASGDEMALNQFIQFINGLDVAKGKIPSKEISRSVKLSNFVKKKFDELEKKFKELNLNVENKTEGELVLTGKEDDISEFMNYLYEFTLDCANEEAKQSEVILPPPEKIKSNNCKAEINISVFHRVEKAAILKKAKDLDVKCDIGYDIMLASGSLTNLMEMKVYLHDLEARAKRSLYPKYWEFQDARSYSEIAVPETSVEFEEVSAFFKFSLQDVKIKKITRIQNKYLMDHYITMIQKRKELRPNQDINRRLLFHGTRTAKPDQIYKASDTGFDIQHAKVSGNYGKGLYFAVHASYSHNGYGYKVSADRQQIILADVFLGKSFKSGPNRNLIKAPDGYDSVEARESFYVIYNNLHSYPLYLIEYAHKITYRYEKVNASGLKKTVDANHDFANFRRLHQVDDDKNGLIIEEDDGRQLPNGGKEVVKKKKISLFQKLFGRKKNKKEKKV